MIVVVIYIADALDNLIRVLGVKLCKLIRRSTGFKRLLLSEIEVGNGLIIFNILRNGYCIFTIDTNSGNIPVPKVVVSLMNRLGIILVTLILVVVLVIGQASQSDARLFIPIDIFDFRNLDLRLSNLEVIVIQLIKVVL